MSIHNLLAPTATEIILERLARLEARTSGVEDRQDHVEADLTTLAEHGTLDLSDRDDALGRLDRQLTKEALRASEDRMWEAFCLSCPTGRVDPLSAAWEVADG